MSHIRGIHHVSIRTSQFDKVVDFYISVLGMKPKLGWHAAPNRALMIDTGDGNYLEFFERPAQPGEKFARKMETAGDIILHLALRVDDVDAVIAKVKSAGYPIALEPKNLDLQNTVPNQPATVPIRIAFFNGPAGELVELFQNELT